MNKARILIVEDEALIAMRIESMLQAIGYSVTSIVNSGEKAIHKAETDKPDLILMDIRLKGEMDGIETADIIRARFAIPVIFTTAYLDEERIKRAKTTMPFGYILKPVQDRDLKVSIEMALYVSEADKKRKQAENKLIQERHRLSDILTGTNAGTWEWNVQTGETIFNERWAEIIGYSLAELSPVSIDTWTKFAHPDDLKVSEDLLQKHFSGELEYYQIESRMRHKNGNWIWVLDRGKVATWTEDGKPLLMSGTHQEITDRKEAEAENERLIQQLKKALAEIKNLSGMLPICASCKKIRDDKGYWNQIESYLESHSEVLFSHGICPECADELYGKEEWYRKKKDGNP